MRIRRTRLRIRDGQGPSVPRRRPRLALLVAATALTTASIATAPSSAADVNDSLKAAVVASRGSTCPPLRNDPLIDQAANDINETTDRWINIASRAVPETDALPVLKDLGYGGSNAKILSGAGHSVADSVKGLLLQGFAILPDCSYTDFGVGTTYNAKKDVVLMTVVLAA